MAYKGVFRPSNPEKYRGDITKIIYRSSWERKFMEFCDHNSSILLWNSEGVVIPYISPVDGERHRYFIDFWIRMRDKHGNIVEKLIEIKPNAQRHPPKEPQRKTKRYFGAVKTYAVNQAKWKAAELIAEQNNMQFVVLDEYDLGIKKRKK